MKTTRGSSAISLCAELFANPSGQSGRKTTHIETALLSPRLRGILADINPVDAGSRGYRAMNTLRIFAIGILAVFLAACQSASYSPRPMAIQQQGFEGNWVDQNSRVSGVDTAGQRSGSELVVSTIRGGRFESRSSASGLLIAQGTYTELSPNLIEINVTPLSAGRAPSVVRCALASQSQLNCTSSTGAQFTLVRQFAG
jgi:hypothetical protein